MVSLFLLKKKKDKDSNVSDTVVQAFERVAALLSHCSHDVKRERLPKKVMAVAHSMVSYVPGTATP